MTYYKEIKESTIRLVWGIWISRIGKAYVKVRKDGTRTPFNEKSLVFMEDEVINNPNKTILPGIYE